MGIHRRGTDEPVVEEANEADRTMVLDPTDDATATVSQVRDRAGSPASGPAYTLVVDKGHQAGRTWLLASGVTHIGRYPYNDIALDHITVSRHHCRISLRPTGLSMTDLGSTNGSYVNDRLIEEETHLHLGDRLMIGTFHLRVDRG